MPPRTHDSQEYASELHDSPDMLKEQLREAKFCADEERRMKSLDGLMNTLLLCVSLSNFPSRMPQLNSVFTGRRVLLHS